METKSKSSSTAALEWCLEDDLAAFQCVYPLWGATLINVMERNVINLNVVSQCNGCHHTVVDVFLRLTFISGKLTKRGVNYC
jgi:hypothetical protein